MIILGLNGGFVLKGTNSSMALVIVGVVFLVFDIIGIVRYSKKRKMN